MIKGKVSKPVAPHVVGVFPHDLVQTEFRSGPSRSSWSPGAQMRRRIFTAAFLVAELVTPALAETCVPIDPATGNECIYDFRLVFDGPFKYMYWNNRCIFEVYVEWYADKMAGKLLVDGSQLEAAEYRN